MEEIQNDMEIDNLGMGVSGRIDANWLLSRSLDRLQAQLLKLPHEITNPQMNENMGVKYSDIQQSFVDGVNGLAAIINPLGEVADATDFKGAFTSLKQIVKIMQENRLFYQKEKHAIIDEADGAPYASSQEPTDLTKSDIEDDMETPPL